MKQMKILLTLLSLLFAGCTSTYQTTYHEVEATDFVRIKMYTGKTVKGSVLRVEPHQIVLVHQGQVLHPIPKSDIISIERTARIRDDFNKGISEEEIREAKTLKNRVVFGIGGGALSFGASFFLGSLIATQSDHNGGAILAGTTLGGGILGTTLFVLAGRKKDRQVAIASIQEKRREAYIIHGQKESVTPESLQDQLNEERLHQEKLRRQREELLRKLDTSEE